MFQTKIQTLEIIIYVMYLFLLELKAWKNYYSR